jgi:uncharacterized damage-inducible protein DinB
MDELRYPIGRFSYDGPIPREQRNTWIHELETLPRELRRAVIGLSESQLETPYRDGGWTVRHVVHHVADVHMNFFLRFKHALTEEQPTIKTFDENAWSLLMDYAAPVEPSLNLVEALHDRWTRLLRSLTEEAFERTYYHPRYDKIFRLDYALGLNAWHGRHHTAHITGLRDRKGWH